MCKIIPKILLSLRRIFRKRVLFLHFVFRSTVEHPTLDYTFYQIYVLSFTSFRALFCLRALQLKLKAQLKKQNNPWFIYIQLIN